MAASLHPRRLVRAVLAAFALASLAAAPSAAGSEPGLATRPSTPALLLQLGAGAYDAVRQDETATQAAFQAALRPRRFQIRPVVGLFVTSKESVYGYIGAAREFSISPRFLVTPQFSAGAFEVGDGKDLGHTVEFLSSLQLAYRFASGSRVGLAYQHISNARLGDKNPGAEILQLTWTWPLQPRPASPHRRPPPR